MISIKVSSSLHISIENTKLSSYIIFRLAQWLTERQHEKARVVIATFMQKSRRRQEVAEWPYALEKDDTGTYIQLFRALLKYKLSTLETMMMNLHIFSFTSKVCCMSMCLMLIQVEYMLPTVSSPYSSFESDRNIHLLYHAYLCCKGDVIYSHFIHITAFGCSNPPSPANGFVDRQGDRAFVTCTYNNVQWKIVCRDDEWHGDFEGCAEGKCFF